MGFFKKDVIKQCSTDKSTGNVTCKALRKNSDGTETTLAEGKWELSGNCDVIPTELSENEEGALADLEKFAKVKASNTCRAKLMNNSSQKPEDY